MKSYSPVFLLPALTLALTLAAFPAQAADTLRVTSPDPILEGWRWTEFDRSSGLARGVRNIFEDRDGDVWFATDRGAQRYDGMGWTTYTTADGLASDRVRAIVQTRDGAMWFGTNDGGISRFDGETWTTYTTADSLANNRILWKGLLQARDGTLWAGFWSSFEDTSGTQAGISRFDGETWTTVEVPVGPPRPRIVDIHQASDGALWFTTYGHGVLRFDLSGWTRYTTEDGLAGNLTIQILESRDGSLWVGFGGGVEGISRFDGRGWRTYTVRDGLPKGVVFNSLWQTQDGTVWAGSGSGGVLCRFDEERWKPYASEEIPQVSGNANGEPMRDGAVWLYDWGAEKAFRFDPASTHWTVYTDMPPLVTSRSAADALFVIDGEVWLNVLDGAVRFDGKTWIKYTAADGLIDGQITTILKAGDGSLWVAGQHGGRSGAARFDGTRWRLFSAEDGLSGENIYTGYAADNGDVWFGTKWGSPIQGAGAIRYDGASWTVYRVEDGLIHNVIYDIAQTPDGAIWFGTLGGLSRFDGTAWSSFTSAETPGESKIRTLTVDRDGSLWIGQAAPSRGATRYDGKTWTRYTAEDGLGNDAVWTIHQDRGGTFWFVTNKGLSRFNGETWGGYLFGEEVPVSPAASSVNQGLVETPDGALWLRRSDRVVRFVPDRGVPETVLGPTVDRVSSAGNILLRWSGHDFWNDTPPDALRFQWRLNGGAWSSAWERADHTFTSLADGRHTFEIRAVDRDGNVDATPAVHAFVVEPPWWKNPWVVGLAVVLLGLGGVQTGRVVRRDRRLSAANEELLEKTGDLEASNLALSAANKELFGVNQALQRDRAVERIRGEVQAMEQASDFEKVLSLLSEDLKAVGLSFDTCGIDVLDEPVDEPSMSYFEGHGFQYTAYTIDPEGIVTRESYHISAPFPPVSRETIERFIAGDPWQAVIGGKQAILEVPASNYGRLRITSSERQDFADEDIEALRDFASAIALGYARYLDIREIQEQTERKSRFLASMSHELRTPMNAIIGFTRMVLRREKNISERNRENLGKVRISADHLLDLINGILDLSKIEAGRMDVEAESFDVKALIAGCCAEVEPLVEAKPGVKLEYEVAEDVREANTDQGRLRQILMNLLSNAIKFTDQGRVAVQVSKDGQAGDGASLVIEVSDTGAGIPADALESIFEEFQQVKGSDPKRKGTGLGLPITKGFAELLGGTIGVQSEVGRGSTFRVRVPVVYG